MSPQAQIPPIPDPSAFTQAPLILAMAALLLCSAVASASETSLFGISHASRVKLRKDHPKLALTVDRLLTNPRQLLLQVLLVNMVINVGYFIATSLLTFHAESATAKVAISIASLFVIILVGEVFAKLAAVAFPTLCLRIVTPGHTLVRQPLRPFIAVLERYFILPGTRLLVPGPPPPPGITPEEMSTLLSLGTTEGLIDQSEQDLLAAIVMLSQRKVEEIMRPRVDFTWLDATATRDDVLNACKHSDATKFPVFQDGLDGTPIGITDAKKILASQQPNTSITDTLTPLLFIPEQATLQTLLNQFRKNTQTIALVVDEHGTVAGLVTLADIADQLLSGIADQPSTEAQDIQMIGPATWSVPGQIAVHQWSTLFGGRTPTNSTARTLAGLIMHTLGRVPKINDEINLGWATLKVHSMNDLVVETVEVTLNLDQSNPAQSNPHTPPTESTRGTP